MALNPLLMANKQNRHNAQAMLLHGGNDPAFTNHNVDD